jgi:intergrase/recombinase
VDLPVGVAAQIMGHAPSAVAEKHYRVRPLDLLRQHADKFESWILSEAKIEFTPAAAQAAPMLKVAS